MDVERFPHLGAVLHEIDGLPVRAIPHFHPGVAQARARSMESDPAL